MLRKLSEVVKSTEPLTPYEVGPHTIVFTPSDLDKYVAIRLREFKKQVRDALNGEKILELAAFKLRANLNAELEAKAQ